MTRLIPSEDELHAYVDERLEPVRRAQVQAWLAANPQAAARVEGWRADARRLRTALAGFGEMPGCRAAGPWAVASAIAPASAAALGRRRRW
jgi:anti-sigma factor RsiW